MFFFKQFETFNPISDSFPDFPFPCMPDIAWRARRILHGGRLEKIIAVATRIDTVISCHVEDLRYTVISELQSKYSPGDEMFEEYFEWDGGTQDNGRWIFKEEMAEELGIPTETNCNEVNVLKTIIDERDFHLFWPKDAPEPEPDEYPEGKDFELFAVLSLRLLVDSLRYARNQGQYGRIVGANYVIMAMDAVCHAEQLYDTEILISNLKNVNKTEVTNALREQATNHKENRQQQNSEKTKDLNIFRHKQSKAAKEKMLEDWEKNRNEHLSATDAGKYYAEWIKSNKLMKKIADRTVAEWIREHAKLKGIILR